MSILNNFDIDQDFWSSNPQFKIPKDFKKFYDEDKSKGKAQSSKILWAIALLLDNGEDNKFRNLSYEDRRALIAEDFLNEPKFKWENYQKLMDGYYALHMSKLERSLNIYEQKLEERDQFIRTAKYNLDSAASLDKIISSTKGIYDLITKLRDEINKEKEQNTTKAGMEESAAEKGEI
jgi:hypothetical protein